MSDPLTTAIASALHTTRLAQDLSASALAKRSGVSRAMIGKIERGDAQPTAVLLSRLAAALGMTLSELITLAERDDRRVARFADQPTWVDPATGYRRRAVSPTAGGLLELVEVELPAGAEVPFPAESYVMTQHQIWVLDGRLHFHEGDTVHELDAGDCLELGTPTACRYHNPTGEPCRYLVAQARRPMAVSNAMRMSAGSDRVE